jgi:hypothetical protein
MTAQLYYIDILKTCILTLQNLLANFSNSILILFNTIAVLKLLAKASSFGIARQ